MPTEQQTDITTTLLVTEADRLGVPLLAVGDTAAALLVETAPGDAPRLAEHMGLVRDDYKRAPGRRWRGTWCGRPLILTTQEATP